MANRDGSVRVLDLETGVELGRTTQKESRCTAILSVSDSQVWCGYADGFIRVFDVVSFAAAAVTAPDDDASASSVSPLVTLSRHTGPVTALVAQPGSRFVFSASDDATILQWDAADCRYIGRLQGHAAGVRALAAHGDRLYSAAADGAVKAWDPFSRDCIDLAPASGSGAAATHLTVCDGRVWCGTADGTLHVWETATAKKRASLAVPAGGAVSALRAVGTTVWAATAQRLSKWDSASFQLLGVSSEADTADHGVVIDAVVTAKRIVSRVWTLAADGRVTSWNTETSVGGDDDADAALRHRDEELVCLRAAMQDLQAQAATLEARCEERVQRVQCDLRKAKEDAEMRACQIAALEARLAESRRLLEVHAATAAKQETATAIDPSESVNKALATHVQITERWLLEAEATSRRLQSEVARERAVTEQRSQRDAEAAETQARAVSQLHHAEVRIRELQRHNDESEATVERLRGDLREHHDANVVLQAQVDLCRRKLDETQKIVAKHALDLRIAEREKARLQAALGNKDPPQSSPGRVPS